MHRTLSPVGLPSAALLASLLALAIPAGRVSAQPPPGSNLPNPRLLTITPTGGKAGTQVELTLTGTDLDDAQALFFSHTGIKAERLSEAVTPPPDPKKPNPKRPAQGAVKFKVTIPAETPLGNHDVRIINKWGISNPRVFVVGDLAEVLEKEPNNDVPEAQRVGLNSTVNGAINNPTDVDYFVFAAKKGQRVVLSCLASSIDSRAHPALELYDDQGKQLGFNRSYHGSDALVDCTLPADGDYYVRLYEFTHTEGSPEHFYRLTITTAPWIDALFPPVVEPGKRTQVTLYGRNLPNGQLDPSAVIDGRILEKATVDIDVPNDPPALHRLAYSGKADPLAAALSGFEYRTRNAVGTSNPFLLTYARAPVVLDNGANDTPETAQQMTVPCEIAGRIEKKRDRDWYAFTAKKGEVYSIEVLSQRLGSPTDMYFVLRNAATKQNIFEGDDNPDVLAPQFFARTDDPAVYRFNVPADGIYQLQVSSRDADIAAGPQYYYRVRITPEMPDFELVAMPPSEANPDGCRLPREGNQSYTVYALRQDGWTGEIALTAEGLPPGVSCQPAILGPGVKRTMLVLSADDDAEDWTGEIKIKGTATIRGQEVVRAARPGTMTWAVQQPNQPAVSRVDRNLVLAVRDQAPYSVTAKLDKAQVMHGDKVAVSFKLSRLWPDFKGAVQLQGVDFPANLNPPQANIAADKDEATMALEIRPNVVPGKYTLDFRATAQVPFNRDPMAKQKQPVNEILPAAPVTLTILPKSVATLTVNVPKGNIKLGMQGEVIVKVSRLYDYAGEFKVQLVLPPDLKNVSADEVTIPAGQDEARVIVKVAPEAAPANLSNLTLRATAMLDGGVPAVHEAKINVNIVK